ncbi:hypothetical protein LINPERPRIM_LOCUS45274 [Linum perenne]
MDPLDTEVWVIPDDSEEIERGLVAVNSPDGDRMWGDPDLHEDDDWEVVAPKQELRAHGKTFADATMNRSRSKDSAVDGQTLPKRRPQTKDGQARFPGLEYSLL